MSDTTAYAAKSKANLTVLGILVLLTAVTVSASYFDFGFLNVAIALAIATSKASLVVMKFMHLGHEERAIHLMVVATCCILAIVIGFIFFDVAAR